MESDLYPPIKRHLERLGLEVKGEVCGCDLVGLSEGSPDLIVIGEMKQSCVSACNCDPLGGGSASKIGSDAISMRALLMRGR